MTLLDLVLAEIDSYSTCSVLEHDKKLNAAYVNLDRAVVSLYQKGSYVHVGYNTEQGPLTHSFMTQDHQAIVERLMEAFTN